MSSTVVSDSGEAFVIVRDITDLKRAEETLRVSEARERARAAELHGRLHQWLFSLRGTRRAGTSAVIA